MQDEKTNELVAVGASMTANCQPCLDFHCAKAREYGAAEAEILGAIAIGKQVRRGAALKMDRHAAEVLCGVSPCTSDDDCRCGKDETGSLSNPGRLFDTIKVPVLLMQRSPRQVVTANKSALDLFQKPLQAVEGHKGGQVFDCIHAFSTAGCGQDVNCEGCEVKNAIVDTFETGNPHHGVATSLQVIRDNETRVYRLRISTEKLGDWALVSVARYEPDGSHA